MDIAFTQFIRPSGARKRVMIDRPPNIARTAERLQKLGARFEIEHLTTGHISMTCEKASTDFDNGVLSQRLCANGPDVPKNVDGLVLEAEERLKALGLMRTNDRA